MSWVKQIEAKAVLEVLVNKMRHIERVKLANSLVKRDYNDDEIILHFVHLEDFDVKAARGHIEFIRRWSGV